MCLYKGLTEVFSRDKTIQRVKGLGNAGGCARRTVERDWREIFGPAAPTLKTFLVVIVLIDLLLIWLEHPDEETKAVARRKELGLSRETADRYLRLFSDIEGRFRLSHVVEIVMKLRHGDLGPLL